MIKKEQLLKQIIKLQGQLQTMERELSLITDAYGTEKTIKVKPYEEAPHYKEADGQRFTRHLFIPDIHFPDHNQKALNAVLNFALDYKPHIVHILGDVVNFTSAGKFPVVGEYDVTLGDEIRGVRDLLKEMTDRLRSGNEKVKIQYYEGNHEQRLGKYLARNAEALKDLTDTDGENILTVPHLFHLKDMGIEWFDYTQVHKEDNTAVEHGNIVRQKSGYTASGMLDKRGRNGYSGHTHRLALITRSQGGDVKFWVECGSLCNLNPTPTYSVEPDWVNGFAIGIYDKKENVMHPLPVLIQNGNFYLNNKIY